MIVGIRWSIDFGDGVSQDAGTTWEDCLAAARDTFREQAQDLGWRRPASPSLVEREFFLRATGEVVATARRQRT